MKMITYNNAKTSCFIYMDQAYMYVCVYSSDRTSRNAHIY